MSPDPTQDDTPAGSDPTSDAPAPTTRERILSRALELFNERGIEYVGVRELARELELQPGNISYHFSTKDDLVLAIGLQLRELNDATIALPGTPTLEGLLETLRQAFRNHWRYRCLFLSLPKLLEQNEAMAEAYVRTREVERRELLHGWLERLVDGGLLRSGVTSEERWRIATFCALVARGWIGEGRVSFPDASPEWRMDHYLHIVADHLEGYATPRGAAELARFRATLGDGRVEAGEGHREDPLRRFHA